MCFVANLHEKLSALSGHLYCDGMHLLVDYSILLYNKPEYSTQSNLLNKSQSKDIYKVLFSKIFLSRFIVILKSPEKKIYIYEKKSSILFH